MTHFAVQGPVAPTGFGHFERRRGAMLTVHADLRLKGNTLAISARQLDFWTARALFQRGGHSEIELFPDAALLLSVSA